jgi:hypothetical protein
VDKHWQTEISAGKHPGDLLHVLPNRCDAAFIGRVISLDSDGPAIREKEEVMSCQSVAETHCDVTPPIDLCSVLRFAAGNSAWGRVRRLLGTCL